MENRLPPSAGLQPLDYAAVALYLVFTFGVALWFARRQHSTEDYFVGGRRMPWFAVGLSILATLLSTNSYLGVPGEVVKNGIGYFVGYLAIPLSMTVVLGLWVPFFMRLRLTSAYEYLERRFNYTVRLLASVLFILLRVGWMSMVVFVVAMVVDEMKGADLDSLPGPDIYWWIGAVGVVAAVYTVLGGIKAMIWIDVLQFVLMLAGVLLAIGYVAYATGTGPAAWWDSAARHSSTHTRPPLFSLDVTVRITIVTAIINNFFWTICTHGSDQVVLQRYFSTPSLAAARRSYLINVAAELTMLILLALSGLALLAFYLDQPSLLPEGKSAIQVGDKLFPRFLATQLPAGCAGLIMAGFLCDALQTLEAGVNSITAVVTTDIVQRLRLQGKRWLNELTLARVLTVVVTALVTLNACWVEYQARTHQMTIVDLMPKTFNMFVGPLAALFFIGMFLPRCTARSAGTAVIVGLGLSFLWSWWKQLFGTDYTPTILLAIAVPCTVTVLLAAVLGWLLEGSDPHRGRSFTWFAVVRRAKEPEPALTQKTAK